MSITARLAAIRQRREALVAQAEAQRQTIADLARPWQSWLALARQSVAIAREWRGHWLTIAAGTALMTWMGRGRWGVWIGRIWMGWKLYRSLHDHPRKRP
jgi:hypothetical protein